VQALRDHYDNQVEELRAELADYESLCRGEITILELDSLEQLPEARTAARLSQEDLAVRLGLKKQQVQRYEATRYAGVSLERIQAIAKALGLTIREQVIFPVISVEHDTNPMKPVSA